MVKLLILIGMVFYGQVKDYCVDIKVVSSEIVEETEVHSKNHQYTARKFPQTKICPEVGGEWHHVH